MDLNDKIQVFNLWNTNGRRSDILNAIDIYLNILFELKDSDPDYLWGNYPGSLSQFLFYKKAIEASPEVFQEHSKYDQFINIYSLNDLQNRIRLDRESKKNLDQNIEMRARHYTSNLVRLGLATEKREVTAAGTAFHNGSIKRDIIEDLLPIETTNLLILRQLLKLRTYTKKDEENGLRTAYSPLFLALYILLSGEQFDKEDFKTIVQALTPYNEKDVDEVIELCKKGDYSFTEREIDIPCEFETEHIISRSDFEKTIKNVKSGNIVKCYYEFYKCLFLYLQDSTDLSYSKLKNVCINYSSNLKQAFGCGKKVFDFGRQNSYDHKEFLESNSKSPLLKFEEFNINFYKEYNKSKIMDQARENSDTTTRLFSATGLISLGKALPQLVDSDIYEIVFNKEFLKNNIFTVITEEEYEEQMHAFEANISLCEILKYSKEDINTIISAISEKLGEDKSTIRTALIDRTSNAFENYVKQCYPREKVVNLLRGFSTIEGSIDSRNQINPSCSIPTAFEYITALAWYYISDKKYDLYDSIKLTMNADFEPERFAPSGTGDIVAKYDDITIMLEVTMMNAQAQKRGEWEPVLRHSVNLRVENAPKNTLTIFVANELDFNTINIWRAVAAVPLKSSNIDETIVSGVVIMPVTTEELACVVEQEVGSGKLIDRINNSYSIINKSFDFRWREKVLFEIYDVQ